MTRRHFVTLSVAATLALAGCSPGEVGSFGEVGSLEQAVVAAPTLRSLPVNWKGTTAQLFVADAAAGCAYVASGNQWDDTAVWADSYLQSVANRMRETVCEPVEASKLGLVQYYTKHRTDTACGASAPSGTPSPIQPVSVPWPAGLGQSPTGAGEAIRTAPFNLCIAQQLRELSPGSAASEALLLSGEDQRELLEAIRERTQIAVLQYALLGVAFQPHTSASTPLQETKLLRDWATTNLDAVRKMGDDFAAALQLDVTVSAEVAQLLGRSGSARLPRGGNAVGADEVWGAGSWRQRMMALLYGGDPLAEAADQTAVWAHPAGKTTPGQGLPQTASNLAARLDRLTGPSSWDWPTQFEQPFVKVDVSEPQVGALESLARQFDALSLKVVSLPKRFYHCTTQIDRAASAKLLYRVVEAGLRTRDCEAETDDACQTTSLASVSDPSLGYASFVLYKKYGITPQHAATLVARLDESVANLCPYPEQTPPAPFQAAYAWGALDVNGTVTSAKDLDGSAGTWWHLSRDVSFVPKALEDLEATYTRYARLRAPSAIEDAVGLEEQGLLPLGPGDDSKRILGAVSALVATRQMIDHTASASSDPAVASYYALRSSLLGVIDAAVGRNTLSVVPHATTLTAGGGTDLVHQNANGAFAWDVSVEAPIGDAWWSAADAQYALVAVPDNPLTATAARFGTSWFQSPDPFAGGVKGASTGVKSVGSATRFNFVVNLPVRDLWTFVVVRQRGAITERRLVGGRINLANFRQPLKGVTADSNRPYDGQYLASEGSLNFIARRTLFVNATNPSQPAFDGFGLPTGYVPPIDPSLGLQAQGSAVAAYLASAQDEANKAHDSLVAALDAMLTVAKDDNTRRQEAVKAAQLTSLEQQSLCGGNSTTCDTSTRSLVLDLTTEWTGTLPTCTDDSGSTSSDEDTGDDPGKATENANHRIDCLTLSLLKSLSLSVSLGTPVVNHKDDPSQPAFPEYQGGTLQGALIEQWADLRNTRDYAREVIAAGEAAKSRVESFQASLDSVKRKVDHNCSVEAMAAAFVAGSSASVGFPSGVSVSFSPGPLIAQIQKCDDLKGDVGPAVQQFINAMLDAFSTMAGETAKLTQAARALQAASAREYELAQQSELARARISLESDLATHSSSLQTSFGLYRAYQKDAFWRAKAVLELARRKAILARRAVEARFVVDLSKLTQDESEVASPQSWADQVYGYELDLPAAVGLTVGTRSAGDIYTYGIADYVGNLKDFVEGYAYSRPSAATRNDSDVIYLPAPLPNASFTASSFSWQFYCPDDAGGRWRPLPASGDVTHACSETGPAPVRARLTFSLDPWGRVDADLVHPPVTRVYNRRWDKLVLNLSGSTVLDCDANPTPACTNRNFVPYNLRHLGPAWTAAYDGTWRALDLPVGAIEGGKAVAADLPIDYSYWTNPYILAATKLELSDRPLGGSYEIDLNPDSDPTVQLERINGLQILMSSNAWVRQE